MAALANQPKLLRAAATATACGFCAYLLIVRALSAAPEPGEPLELSLARLDRAEWIGFYDPAPPAQKADLLLGRARTLTGDARKAVLSMAHTELGRVVAAQPLHGRAWALRLWLDAALWSD